MLKKLKYQCWWVQRFYETRKRYFEIKNTYFSIVYMSVIKGLCVYKDAFNWQYGGQHEWEKTLNDGWWWIIAYTVSFHNFHNVIAPNSFSKS